jgi:multiple sugar transport system permease protein
MAETAGYMLRRLVLAGIGREGLRFLPGRVILRILRRLIAAAAGLVMVFPFLWMVLNSFGGYMISSAANILTIFFFRQVFLGINRSVLEAARIDGAGHRVILWRIVVPMSASVFAVMGVLNFIGSYNNYLWPSLILKRKADYLVSMGLRSFFSAGGAYGIKWGDIMAACCVVVVPLLLIFAVSGRWIIKGITGDCATKE